MFKVQKHIIECQNEVKSNIFNEAFSLINHHAFHHPDDHTTIGDHVHDEFKHPNFTLTEQEILKFFQNHDHTHVDHLSTGNSHSGNDHSGTVEVLHEEEPIIEHHESIKSHHEPVYDPILHRPIPNPHSNAWQHSYPPETLYKKTDDGQTNKKPEDVQHEVRSLAGNHNPYTYFNIKTGEAERSDRPRRHVHSIDLHSDSHHSSEIHHSIASFKDKRIAGVSDHMFFSFKFNDI